MSQQSQERFRGFQRVTGECLRVPEFQGVSGHFWRSFEVLGSLNDVSGCQGGLNRVLGDYRGASRRLRGVPGVSEAL